MYNFYHYQNNIRHDQHKVTNIVKNGKYRNMNTINNLKIKINLERSVGSLPKKGRVYYNDRRIVSSYFYISKSNYQNSNKQRIYSEDHLPFTDFFGRKSGDYGSTLFFVNTFRTSPTFAGYSYEGYCSKNSYKRLSNHEEYIRHPTRKKNKLNSKSFYNCNSLDDLLARLMISDMLIIR